MNINEDFEKRLIQVVDDQIRFNNPPETKLTLKRLINKGYTKDVSKHLIGQCVAVEIRGALVSSTPFNSKRYVKNLEQLPKKPIE